MGNVPYWIQIDVQYDGDDLISVTCVGFQCLRSDAHVSFWCCRFDQPDCNFVMLLVPCKQTLPVYGTRRHQTLGINANPRQLRPRSGQDMDILPRPSTQHHPKRLHSPSVSWLANMPLSLCMEWVPWASFRVCHCNPRVVESWPQGLSQISVIVAKLANDGLGGRRRSGMLCALRRSTR